jgi:hypothetical protein
VRQSFFVCPRALCGGCGLVILVHTQPACETYRCCGVMCHVISLHRIGRLWHGRLFHGATPNYSANPPMIRQMALYDVVSTLTYDSFYDGYERGPCPSPPPNKLIAEQHPGALQKGTLAPRSYSFARLPEEERADPDFWWDWSDQVRTVGHVAASL